MTYKTEFPDFELDVAIPVGWTDESWHNDTCPKWMTPSGLTVWVEYADPYDRECDPPTRFLVCVNEAAGGIVLATDDWREVLEYCK